MKREKWNKRLAAMMTLVILFGMLPFSQFGSEKVHAIAAQDAVEGLTWTSKSSGAATALRGVTHGNGTFVAVGTPPMPFTGNNGPMQNGDLYRTSTDGEAWSTRTTGTSHELRSVTYGSNGFVGVGYYRDYYYGQQKDYGQISTSADGLNWNRQNNGTGNAFFGVTYGGNGYVAVGATYDIDFNATPLILSSTNGVTWTSRHSQGSGTLNAIAYGNGLYVAVGSLGTILTSPDAVTWTASNSTVTSNIRNVTYGNGVFLAVGSGGKILTSSDGAAWTLGNPPATHTTTAFWGATYGKGTYLIVGNNGTILSSTDAQTWTARESGTTNPLYAAVYDGETFMAVGEYGTVLIGQYQLEYSAGAGGSLTGAAAQGVTPGASGSAVTAVPDVGYQFVSWSDGETAATRTDNNIFADKSVTANFEIKVYSLTYTADAGGSLSGIDNQSVIHGSDGTEITAVPDAHYHFTGWSDGYATANRTDSNVTDNKAVSAGFAIDTFALSYSASAGGTITGLASQNVDYGEDGALVTATPNTGYHFVNWSDGVEAEARTETNVIEAKSLTANFAINEYLLTYSAGANGSLEGTASQTVNHGSNGTEVTAKPAAGYHFVNWSDGETAASRTDLQVTGSKNVTANFAINAYSLTYTAGAGGSLTGTTGQTVNHGSDATTVTAVPNTGYHFIGWSDAIMDAARTDVNVTGNIAATASFAINAYTLNYTAGDGGTLTGTASQSVNHGLNGTAVTATPDAGYHFVSWSDGELSATRTDSVVTGSVSVVASFAINEYTLQYAANAGGSLEGTSSQNINHGSSGTMVTAKPDEGYHFVGWSDGATTASRTDSPITGNINVSASFAINEYTLTYSAGQNGSLSGLTTQTVKHGDDGTTVTASPAAGYHFVSWSDGVQEASRIDLQVEANKSVTANFSIDTFTLTYTSDAGGTLDGVTVQQVNHGADGTEVTAIPDTGYDFVDWSDGETAASRTDMNITSNKSLIAHFAIREYTLNYTAGMNGSLEGSTSQTVNHGASGATVTAVPAAGYHFVSWSDGVLDAARTDSSVSNHIQVSASFAINEYTLEYTTSSGGSLSGMTTQKVNHGSDGTEVAAAPDPGYTFTGWSDGITTARRTDLEVTADLHAVAEFTIIPLTSPSVNSDVPILINGKPMTIGIMTSSTRGDQTVKKVALDPAKLEQMIAGKGQVITIQLNTAADVFIAELTGQTIQMLEQMEVVLLLQTDFGAYTLPANRISVSELAKQLGQDASLANIKLEIEMSKSSAQIVKMADEAAIKGGYTIVLPPLDFSIKARSGNSSMEWNQFKEYVERMAAIPAGVDAKKITTGVVVEADGTIRHVPTKIVILEGKTYAAINSLTNSTYAVIWNPITYPDVANHWAMDAVNDMGSRKIINGVSANAFKPDQAITRAEFAAIIVRALGLKPEPGSSAFTDVKASDWYSSYVQTAYANDLISGFGEHTFKPTDKITREQAMTIIAKMMKLTGLQAELQENDAEQVLSQFEDSDNISGWAKESIIACLQSGIVSGKTSKLVAPKDLISRAEVAMLAQRILKASGLI
ncbi:InlB B-repeat-containing protein [Paenibacillus sp. 2TAB23]|uniref:InlB B-repeat-containing protein n=1 Tax=Paenibacillus sp. 2TAB23 TaxID=3233004 RepID=UPI003F9A6B3D